jgi:hypothetical protein
MSSKRIKEISDELGIPEKNINTSGEQWAIPLIKRGVIVKVEIKYWRARKTLSESEIGINMNEKFWGKFSKEYISLGTKALLPRDVLGKIKAFENVSRKNLKDNSFETVWGHFVPCTMFFDWKQKNNELEEEFKKIIEEIVEKYDESTEKVIQEYSNFCKNLWDSGNVNRETWSDYDSFKSSFLTKIKSEIITKESFRQYSEYNTFYFFIPTPDEVEKNISETKKHIIDSHINEQEKNMKLQLRQEMEKYKNEQFESFIDSTVSKIRESIIEMIVAVRNGVANEMDYDLTIGKNKKRIESMIKKIRGLNFIDNKEIDNIVDEMKSEIMKPREHRNNDSLWSSLRELETFIKKDFGQLQDKQINSLEI